MIDDAGDVYRYRRVVDGVIVFAAVGFNRCIVIRRGIEILQHGAQFVVNIEHEVEHICFGAVRSGRTQHMVVAARVHPQFFAVMFQFGGRGRHIEFHFLNPGGHGNGDAPCRAIDTVVECLRRVDGHQIGSPCGRVVRNIKAVGHHLVFNKREHPAARTFREVAIVAAESHGIDIEIARKAEAFVGAGVAGGAGVSEVDVGLQAHGEVELAARHRLRLVHHSLFIVLRTSGQQANHQHSYQKFYFFHTSIIFLCCVPKGTL